MYSAEREIQVDGPEQHEAIQKGGHVHQCFGEGYIQSSLSSCHGDYPRVVHIIHYS